MDCPVVKRQRYSSKWAELPICLLSEIMHRLDFIDDYVRFGAVCVSWRIAFVHEQDDKVHETPVFLLLPSLPPYKEELIRPCRLYNLSNKKLSNIQMNFPFDKHCRGSNFGWLVTMQKERKPAGYNNNQFVLVHIQLHNPLLSDNHNMKTINLPPIVAGNNGRPLMYLQKAILSSDPLYAVQNKKFVVMSIVGSYSKLAFYRKGDKHWTPIQEQYQDFDDVIYFKKTKLFYAVTFETGAVFSVGLIRQGKTLEAKLTQIAAPLLPFPRDVCNTCTLRKRYLVETSSGDLLQVIKVMSVEEGKLDDRCMEVKFEVLKLDPLGRDWIRMYNIGDVVLFLGDNGSIARFASQCPGCKPNSIYYMYDLTYTQQVGRWFGAQDAGIYNLEDGTIQPYYPLESKLFFRLPIWFEPTLGRCN